MFESDILKSIRAARAAELNESTKAEEVKVEVNNAGEAKIDEKCKDTTGDEMEAPKGKKKAKKVEVKESSMSAEDLWKEIGREILECTELFICEDCGCVNLFPDEEAVCEDCGGALVESEGSLDFDTVDEIDEDEDLDEKFKMVVRGGRKLRVAVHTKAQKRKFMTPKRRAALKKARLKMLSKKSLTKAKRAKSMKRRKSFGLKEGMENIDYSKIRKFLSEEG